MSLATTASTRMDRARALLDELALDALLVSRNANKRYLSGFVIARGDEATSGFSGTLLVTRDRQILLTDARYLVQAADESPGWDVRRTQGRFAGEVGSLLTELAVHRCGAEATVLSHADWAALTDATHAELLAIDAPLNALRLRKDVGEVDAIARAADLTDRCFAHLCDWLRLGIAEQEVAWEIERWFRDNGAEALAFDPIVLVGARAAMPHGRPSDVAVTAGEPLLIDFGCQVDGYRSDMTRTLFVGAASKRQRQLYDVVLAAQQAAYDALRPGVIGTTVDDAAREVIAAAGYGDAFSHGLGHGIGLETHEAPMLLTYDRPLEAGMVLTLEPGIYLAGEIGIRIEDDVALTDDGPRRLTSAPRELIVI
ncbi:MAG TPA: Xaa-Pro peptidase family protein [Candidatus Limnocylindria bacterium]|nr:Xaa-Pro peptidase family protein [Candidatus Limnocylindria bacterium]